MADAERVGRWRISAATVLSLTLALASCASPADASPHSAREKLTSTIVESAAVLGGVDWAEVAPAEGGNCGDLPGQRVNYDYWYNAAPQPDRDHAADARLMAEHWAALGMDVRVVESPSYVVYATGGPVAGLSFSTAPGNYYIVGTSLCVPGDADEIRKQDNG